MSDLMKELVDKNICRLKKSIGIKHGDSDYVIALAVGDIKHRFNIEVYYDNFEYRIVSSYKGYEVNSDTHFITATTKMFLEHIDAMNPAFMFTIPIENVEATIDGDCLVRWLNYKLIATYFEYIEFSREGECRIFFDVDDGINILNVEMMIMNDWRVKNPKTLVYKHELTGGCDDATFDAIKNRYYDYVSSLTKNNDRKGFFRKILGG